MRLPVPHQGSGEPQPPPPGWGPRRVPRGQAKCSGSGNAAARAGLTYGVGGKAKLLRAKAFHKGSLASPLSCLITILQASWALHTSKQSECGAPHSANGREAAPHARPARQHLCTAPICTATMALPWIRSWGPGHLWAQLSLVLTPGDRRGTRPGGSPAKWPDSGQSRIATAWDGAARWPSAQRGGRSGPAHRQPRGAGSGHGPFPECFPPCCQGTGTPHRGMHEGVAA